MCHAIDAQSDITLGLTAPSTITVAQEPRLSLYNTSNTTYPMLPWVRKYVLKYYGNTRNPGIVRFNGSSGDDRLVSIGISQSWLLVFLIS